MTQPQRLPPNSLTARLNAAIDAHVDAEDRAEFLDTILAIAAQNDAAFGFVAGDHYLEDVIRSLSADALPEDEPT